MSPSKDHRLNIRLSDEGRSNIEALAEATGGSMTGAIDGCLPDSALIPGLVAAARYGRGLAPETRTLLLAGMIGRLDNARLGVVQATALELAVRRGDAEAIVDLFAQVVEAESADPARRFELVPVAGDDGFAIVPRGWCARQDGAELVIVPPKGTSPESVIRDLRSERYETRARAAITAAACLGAGLGRTGASDVDLAFGVGRDLAELLERAVEGDGLAVDALEKVLTTDQSKASTTPRESSPRAAKREIS